VENKFPMPLVDEILDELIGATIFSSVTPAFYKNKILSTQERIEDAYQFALHMKNLSKINLV
jgi:hypothetical protein